MIDIYCKILNEDPDYQDGVIDLTNRLQIYLQQIKNLFNVDEGAVMGAVDMSLGIEHLVYEMGFSQRQLEMKIHEQILKYCSMSDEFTTTISTRFFNGTQRDICFVDVLIDGTKKLEFRVS